MYGRSWAILFIVPVMFNSNLIYYAHHVNVQNLMWLSIIVHVYLVMYYYQRFEIGKLGLSAVPISIAIASQISAAVILVPFIILLFIHLLIHVPKPLVKDHFVILIKYIGLSVCIYIMLTPGIILYFKNTIQLIFSLVGLADIPELSGGDFKSIPEKNINLYLEYGKYILNYFGRIGGNYYI